MNNNVMNNGGSRISWIDAVKGLAVLLVIYAHALPSSPLVDVISTFHVPLFVVITGYLIGDKEYTKERAIQKYINTFLKNIYKYIFYAIIALFVTSVVEWMLHSLSIAFVVQNIYGIITGYGGSFALWYVASYLIGLGLFYIIHCKVNSNKTRYTIAVLLTIPAMIYDWCLRESIDNIYLISYPLISLLRSATFVFYLEVGTYTYKKIKKVSWKTEILASMILTSVVAVALFNGYTNYSFLMHGKYPFALYYCGAFGSVSLIITFQFLYKKMQFKLLEFSGRNSLLIMSTHRNWEILFFSQIIINHCIYRLPEKPNIYFYLYGMLCIGIVMSIEAMLVLFANKIKNIMKIDCEVSG